MDKETVHTEEKQSFPIKKVIIALAIIFPVLSSILFGYLYLTDTNARDLDTTTDPILLDDSETEKEVETAVCDFEKIEADILKDGYRVKTDYKLILDPHTLSDHALCKDTLKTRIKGIFEKQDSALFEAHELNEIKSRIDGNYISYLIDDTFIVNNTYKFWSVDLVDESVVDTFWVNENYLGVGEILILHQRDSAKMFFQTASWGLGGSQSDAKYIDQLIEDDCESGNVGFWMYDTITDSFTKIAESEECL